MPSKRVETAKRYIEAFEALSVETFKAITTENCQHFFAPASMNLPSPKSADDFLSHISNLREVIARFPVAIQELTESEAQNQVVVHATGQPFFHKEVMDGEEGEWEYHGEYVFLLSMEKSGEKVSRVLEFLDSKATDRLRGLMARARKNREVKMSGVRYTAE